MTIGTTVRHGLPLLASGQAQKEIAHNEALAQLDLLAHAAVEAVQDAPPVAPASGQCWIVGASPTGAWANHAGAIGCWSANGWRFADPAEGMRAWVEGAQLWAERAGGVWTVGSVLASELRIAGDKVVGIRQPAIADPAGGAAPDVEARAVLTEVLGALRAHGLIAG